MRNAILIVIFEKGSNNEISTTSTVDTTPYKLYGSLIEISWPSPPLVITTFRSHYNRVFTINICLKPTRTYRILPVTSLQY